MSRTKSLIARAALIALAGAYGPSSLASTGDAALDILVSERFALIADESANAPDAGPAMLKQSVALLDLARDLNPGEVRFARSLADILLRLGERDRAIDALAAIRKIDPTDQVAMIQYIDLVTSRMETAEQKVAYLKQVIEARGSVAPEVQAHAAVQLMDLYYARAQDSEASDSLALALKLNPQNLEALKAKYRIAAASGVRRDRVKALVELVRASPADPNGMNALAHEADSVGSYESSGFLRILALNAATARGIAPSAEQAIDFVSTQMLAGNDSGVAQILDQLLASLKEDGRVYTLGLLFLQMHDAPEEKIRAEIESARGVYLAQLAGVSQLLNDPDKKEMPATRPAVPMPNVREDVAKLLASDPKGLKVAYAVALAEQLWFDLFFQAAEVDDANIEALAKLLGENDPIVVRFQGWKLLGAGKKEEARIKLDAAADRDGFARLGKIFADQQTGSPEKARAELTQMIRERPSGMIAAYAAAFSKRLQVVVDATAAEQEISDMITAARGYISDVLTNPRGSYLLTAQPTKVSYSLGEPILATVTLLNNGHVPITVGPGGLIEPDFVVDVQVRTTPPQGFPATARGKFTGVVRLKPSQKLTQTIRVDRDQLFRFLRSYPTPLFPFTGYVITNAVSDGPASFKAGPGGQQSKLGRAFERTSSPLYTEEFRKAALAKIVEGSAAERTSMAELFGYLVGPLKEQSENAEAQAMQKTLNDALVTQVEKELNPEVKAWMQLSYKGELSEQQWVMNLAKSGTLLGQTGAMLSARLMPKETREAVAKAVLSATPTGPVADLANALMVQPDLNVGKTTEEVETLPSDTR